MTFPATTAEVRRVIERETRWNTGKGPLTTAEVDDLLLMARSVDADGNDPDLFAEWTASTALTLTTKRVPVVRNGYVFRVTVAGTTGATEPTWPTTIGATVVDGTITWVNDSVALWAWSWDWQEAAATGCEWRAKNLADSFDVKVGGGREFTRFQTPQFWLEQANRLRGVTGGRGSGLFSVQLRTYDEAVL